MQVAQLQHTVWNISYTVRSLMRFLRGQPPERRQETPVPANPAQTDVRSQQPDENELDEQNLDQVALHPSRVLDQVDNVIDPIQEARALREAQILFGQLLGPPRCVCFGFQFAFSSLGDSVCILSSCGCGAIIVLVLVLVSHQWGLNLLVSQLITPGVAVGTVLAAVVLAYVIIKFLRSRRPFPHLGQLECYEELYEPPLGPVGESNPIVFFDIEIVGVYMGRVEMELKADVAPRAAENFLKLCTGEQVCESARRASLCASHHLAAPLGSHPRQLTTSPALCISMSHLDWHPSLNAIISVLCVSTLERGMIGIWVSKHYISSRS